METVKKAHVVILVLVVSAVTAYLATQFFTTERQRVARVVKQLVRRIERRDAAGFCLLLAEDYKDNNGHNRAAMRSLLSRWLPQLGSVSVTISELHVEAHEGEEKTATVGFDANVVVYQRGRPELPPWSGGTPVRLRLRKRDGEWRVTDAEYRMPRWQYGRR
jgi:hypothetical protein